MLNLLTRKRRQEQDELEEFIAHEIHDGACQYAIAAQMAFQTYRREKRETVPENWKNFDTGMAFLDNAIDELRRLICGLQPIQLSAGGLEAAIACLIKEIQSAGGPDVQFRHDIDGNQVPSHLQRAAFRIVQESLANACRHSKSPRLLVVLTQDRNMLSVQVEDWGVGFDPGNVPDGHFGLEGIRRRDQAVGRYSGHPQPTG